MRAERVPAARLVLANLLAPLLLHWCEQMGPPTTKRPRSVIASGLLASEADRVSGAFSRAGYSEERRLERGEWAALLLEFGDGR
jgi:ribosomal protein L11 methylase PrmA